MGSGEGEAVLVGGEGWRGVMHRSRWLVAHAAVVAAVTVGVLLLPVLPDWSVLHWALWVATTVLGLPWAFMVEHLPLPWQDLSGSTFRLLQVGPAVLNVLVHAVALVLVRALRRPRPGRTDPRTA